MRRFTTGTVDQYLYFVAVDSTDYVTRKTGLSAFTVYRARNGGTATVYTTPTIAEVSSANMPGVYTLLLDEDMTIGSGNNSEEMCLHITCATMAPATVIYELYRPTATEGNQILTDANGRLDVIKLAGTTQTARDIGASVLLSAGTGTGQLDFTSGVVKGNVTQFNGVAATSASGRPEVNTTHIAGSSVATGTAQIGVNVVNFGGVAGTFASGRPEVNTSHIAGAAVSTSTAQIGVNVVNFGGLAGTFASGRPETNTTHIAGSAVSTASAQIGVNVVNAGGTAWGSGAITAASIATDAITASKIAADAIGASELAADAVTEIQTGLSTLTQANVRTAVGLASANLDTQLAALATIPTANANADALLDRTDGVETGLTLRQSLRLMAATLFGKASGLNTTTATFRDTNDTKNRITATVDPSGNRTVVTKDST